MPKVIDEALDELAGRFAHYDWTYYDVPGTSGSEKTWHWLGADDESVMVCVYRGRGLGERFHRQDFFFFNYAYQGSFNAMSRVRGQITKVAQGELIVGQPYTGYALQGNADEQVTVVGVLVRKELFWRTLLPLVSQSRHLVHFFLDPETDARSNKLLHLRARRELPYRSLLNLMVVEYARGGQGTQEVLQALALTLTIYAARHYELERAERAEDADPDAEGDAGGVVEAIVDHIAAYPASATLASTAAAFGYHPNYLSGMLHAKTGKTFSQIRLEERMKRADLLLASTDLTVEEVSSMLGYASTSNFYATYRRFFGHSPRMRRM